MFPELYKSSDKPVISFEVFPPKTPEGQKNLLHALDELAKLNPGFISVTYGAMGTSRERTFALASHIKNELGIEAASHLTCVGASKSDIDLMLAELCAHGIDNIVALRGDPAAGETVFTPVPGGYAHANELVSHIRRFGAKRFGIAVAGYPEKHSEAPSMEADIANLKRKIRAGADAVITQLFYDNSFYFSYASSVKICGITDPIVPGLMPIRSLKQVVKITSICGSSIPKAVVKRLEECERKRGNPEQAGIEICVEQAAKLLDEGVPGIHFYVLNKSSQIKSILKRLGI